MRCRKVRSFLSAYCSDELNVRRKLAVSEHLSACSSCRQQDALIRSMNSSTSLATGSGRYLAFSQILSATFILHHLRAYFNSYFRS